LDHPLHWFPLFGLAIPLAAMGIAAFAMWLRYRRQIATLELLRTYATQGKEPPAEIANIVRNGGSSYGRYRDWRTAILCGCLAAAFFGLAYFSGAPRPHHGFVVAAVVLAAVALGSALSSFVRPRYDGR